ncbi:hypothetical protein C0989_005941 [Termitomyces sp. Mn162]|nr:hypothetical protein C0989_005941 [Termitomyces sp. Mn162]
MFNNSNASSSTLPRLLNPGIFDRKQNQRIRRHPDSKISFASFDPHTATSDMILPDLEQLSLKAELNRSTRIVIETLPSGVSTWRFVPKAQKAAGIPDEGTWPRVVETFGSFFLCSQEQWDIFKLDPLYHCYIRAPPGCPLITKRVQQPLEVPQHTPHNYGRPARPSPSQPRNRARFQIESDSEEEQDEVEGMIIDDEYPTQKSTPQEKHRKKGKVDRKTRREKTARRTEHLSRENNPPGTSKAARSSIGEFTPSPSKFTFDGTWDDRSKSAPAQPAPGKRKVNFLFDSLQTNGGHDDDMRFKDDTPPRDAAANYTSSKKKKARTVSPDAIRKTLRAKRTLIRQQRKEQRKREFEMRRMNREEILLREALMSDVEMPDAASMEPPMSQGTVEMHSPSPERQSANETEPIEEKTPVPEDVGYEGVAHIAKIEESKRKMAELEKDRPLWNAAATRRMEQQRLDEEALKREAAERRAKKAQRECEERARREEEERKKKEEAAQTEQQKEMQRLIDRENERRQRLQRMFNYWSSAAWSAPLALDRYRALLYEFGQAKFMPGIIPLRTCDVPWPVLLREYTLECVTLEEITKFFDTMRAILSMEDYKDLLKKSSLRFHPDHWSTRLNSVVNEAERKAIAEGIPLSFVDYRCTKLIHTSLSQHNDHSASHVLVVKSGPDF